MPATGSLASAETTCTIDSLEASEPSDMPGRERILLELDVKGAMSVKKLYPNKSLSIFIEPPSVEVLKLRLEKRGTDNSERIIKRLERLESELSYKSNFDYHVINDDLDQAVNEIMSIIKNESKGVSYGS